VGLSERALGRANGAAGLLRDVEGDRHTRVHVVAWHRELDGAEHLLLQRGELRQRCHYRVTAFRLALRCAHEAEGGFSPPSARRSTTDPRATLVFYRLR